MDDSAKGAVVAASLALIGLVSAKESKTSEFRQQWIDGLRSDISTFVSLSLQIAQRLPNVEEHIRVANECLARIKLRLNAKEEINKKLINVLKRLEDSAEAGSPNCPVIAEEVVKQSQEILKNEWRRVKRGEWKYVALLCVSILSLIGSLSTLIIPWLKLHHS